MVQSEHYNDSNVAIYASLSHTGPVCKKGTRLNATAK